VTPGGLLDATKDLGVRFRLVGLLPTAALGLFIVALVWSGAPGQAPDPDRIATRLDDLAGWEGVLAVLLLLVVSLILEPLQLSLVRLLEGYWGDARVGRLLAAPGKALHRSRRARLDTKQQRRGTAPDERLGEREAAARRLRRYPPPTAMLPTLLGNTLRAAEFRAGSRYGLDAVVLWPRLYPLLSDRVTAILDDLRDQLDLAARFCAVFIVGTGVSAALLARHGWWLTVPAVTLVLAWLSYRGAVAAAIAYGEAIEAAFDLHRFDLLRALHLPLPSDLITEVRENQQLTRFLHQPREELFRLLHTGKGSNFVYEHEPPPPGGQPPAVAAIGNEPPAARTDGSPRQPESDASGESWLRRLLRHRS
jgi:hypothetical protein